MEGLLADDFLLLSGYYYRVLPSLQSTGSLMLLSDFQSVVLGGTCALREELPRPCLWR
jgi:hypothetical protein